jgi:hydrogenase nickel incorporation protein HypA/HybF
VHELSVCQALLTQVAEIARKRGADAVERITIELGPLCGVEPTLLVDAFAIMRLRGIASAAELRIEPIAVAVSCLACGARTETRANRLVCAACGGFRTRVVAGDELRLLRVEMRVPEPLLADTA